MFETLALPTIKESVLHRYLSLSNLISNVISERNVMYVTVYLIIPMLTLMMLSVLALTITSNQQSIQKIKPG